VTTARVGKRLGGGVLRVSRGRPFVRAVLVGGLAAAVAAAAFVLLPNGDYRPIQPGEKGTIQGSFTAATHISTGRPGLTEERAGELGGAPRISDGAGIPGSGVDETSEEDPGTVPVGDDEEEQEPQEEDSPSPSYSPPPEESSLSPAPSPTYTEE
jgi:hypothetical protein